MKKADKMNILYKIAVILMFVCIALFGGAFFVGSVIDKRTEGVLIAVAGCVLCVVAIILAMFSKPKKPKIKVYEEDNSPEEIKENDTEEEIDEESEISADLDNN